MRKILVAEGSDLITNTREKALKCFSGSSLTNGHETYAYDTNQQEQCLEC